MRAKTASICNLCEIRQVSKYLQAYDMTSLTNIATRVRVVRSLVEGRHLREAEAVQRLRCFGGACIPVWSNRLLKGLNLRGERRIRVARVRLQEERCQNEAQSGMRKAV